MTMQNNLHFKRQKKKVIFWGCEGSSECHYAKLLNKIFNRAYIPVALKVFDLGKAGSIPRKIDFAITILDNEKRKGTKYFQQFVVLDVDRAQNDPNEKSEAERKSRQFKIVILWQHPCFEGFLIKHFDKTKSRAPSTCQDAEKMLKKVWTDYKKPETVRRLDEKIQLDPNIKILVESDSDFKRVIEGFGLHLS